MSASATGTHVSLFTRLKSKYGKVISQFDRYQRILILVFIVTLPLSNPWVRGDGVGYYAYARSILIEGNLNFEKDWQHGNESFVMDRVEPNGQIRPEQYTGTGHIDNHWSVGPSILWAPFLAATHVAVLGLDVFGAQIPADGFSKPYLVTMALATSTYGFLGLWLSYSLALTYFDQRCAFLGTLGIWWASSLPVYMYFNPSWSHAHSAFADALFLWFWNRTRTQRTTAQWIILGLISGLMVDVYYPSVVLLIVPLLEAISAYRRNWKSAPANLAAMKSHFIKHSIYLVFFVGGLLPTLVSRDIIFGGALRTGYPVDQFAWTSPALLSVLFSSDHGLLSWTPIIGFAFAGLALFYRCDKLFDISLIASLLSFYYIIAVQPTWDGMASFGSRYFVSLTPVFVLGLASFISWFGRAWRSRQVWAVASSATALLILWNLGLIFQWGTHLIPARGPISWRDAAFNQVAVVPVQAARQVETYFIHRHQMMKRIEQQDVEHIRSQRNDSEGSSR